MEEEVSLDSLGSTAMTRYRAVLDDCHIYDMTDGDGLTPLGEGIAWWLAKGHDSSVERIRTKTKTALTEIHDYLQGLKNPHPSNHNANDQRRAQWGSMVRSKKKVVRRAMEIASIEVDA